MFFKTPDQLERCAPCNLLPRPSMTPVRSLVAPPAHARHISTKRVMVLWCELAQSTHCFANSCLCIHHFLYHTFLFSFLYLFPVQLQYLPFCRVCTGWVLLLLYCLDSMVGRHSSLAVILLFYLRSIAALFSFCCLLCPDKRKSLRFTRLLLPAIIQYEMMSEYESSV